MATAIEARIADLLLARLGTLALTPPLPVAYPGVAFPGQNSDGSEKAMPSSFLAARLMPNRNRNDFISDGSSTEFRGILQITIAVPAGQGLIEAMEIAGAVAAHFERGTILHDDVLKIRIDGRPSIAPPDEKPERISLPVSVPYFVFA